jgi:hypothetical protein
MVVHVDYPVGTKFDLDGKTYKVESERIAPIEKMSWCEQCDCRPLTICGRAPACSPRGREDLTRVFFKEVIND